MIREKIYLNQILELLKSQIVTIYGASDDVYIDNLADVQHVGLTTLDWVNSTRKDGQELAENSPAKVILVDEKIVFSYKIKQDNKTLVVVKDPKLALAIVGNEYFVQKPTEGIHPTAIIDNNAKIGKHVSIGPYAVIGNVEIGDDSVVSSFVRLYDNVKIGNNCFIKEGAVIGGAGFGFERDEEGNRFRFPQIGGVIIGNNVEIGGNTCIDRGALSDTVIEDYAKIDNLCHIAHNAHIGKNAVVVACAEVSGSCSIGEETWVGPNACIRDQRSVGSNTMVGMGAVVVKHIGNNEVWAGNPAKKMTKE